MTRLVKLDGVRFPDNQQMAFTQLEPMDGRSEVIHAYDTKTGEARKEPGRRPASYWYRTEKTGSAQARLFAEEERDDLPLVNLLREDIKRWREADYRGASNVTRELLHHWTREDRSRRLFFCQREAVETVIYLAEMRFSGRT